MELNGRQEKILALLRHEDAVEIAHLCSLMAVSRETVRKDISELDRAGLLLKVRGGAVARPKLFESAYGERRMRNIEAKQTIAACAIDLIDHGMTIYLDYGTTIYMLATRLDALRGLTVVTASLPTAMMLATYEGIDVILLGGIIRSNENSLYGPPALRNLELLNIDMGFFSCAGIDIDGFLNNYHIHETALSRYAISRCAATALLIDGTKAGVNAPNILGKVSDFNYCIHAGFDKDYRLMMSESGIKVLSEEK